MADEAFRIKAAKMWSVVENGINLPTARYAVSDNATQVWWVNKKIKNKYQSMPLGSELCIKQNIRRVEKHNIKYMKCFMCTYKITYTLIYTYMIWTYMFIYMLYISFSVLIWISYIHTTKSNVYSRYSAHSYCSLFFIPFYIASWVYIYYLQAIWNVDFMYKYILYIPST